MAEREAAGQEGAPRHVVLGTAGHIDHGKTSLVKALTGTDTDRLPEEKRRGITIELGFARWELGEGLIASIVDVPGHERFVRTMASGAAGIDAVVLVVAADDGVMPQTREHLAICSLLGISRGAVAVTKRDLVDEDMAALVEEDVRLAAAGTFLEGAPVIGVSSTTGQGLDALAAAVRGLFVESDVPRGRGPAFLPIDRAFVRPGFGVVVTGTLLSGELAEGDKVDVLPGPRGEVVQGGVVRGLQRHGEAVASTGPGTRLAVNVRGIEIDDVARGAVLGRQGAWAPTSLLHVAIDVLPGADSLILENDELALHLGTADVQARVVPLDREPIEPGTRKAARLHLSSPVACTAGQRFILRKPGARGQGTLGGGVVFDPAPSPGKGSFRRGADAARLLLLPRPEEGAAAQTDDEVAAAWGRSLLVEARAEGIDTLGLQRRSPPRFDMPRIMEALAVAGEAVPVGEGAHLRYVAAGHVTETEREVEAALRRFHEARPFLSHLSPGEVRSSLPPHHQGLADVALSRLAAQGRVESSRGGVRLAGVAVRAEVEATFARVKAALAAAPLAPPSFDELAAAVDVEPAALEDVLAELKRSGTVSELGSGLYFTEAGLVDVERRVRAHFAAGKEELTPAAMKDLLGGLTRKHVIPLLEWLDQRGVTRRRGDVRVPGTAPR